MVGIWCSLEKAFNLSVHVGIYFQNKIFGVSGAENRGMGVSVSVQFSCSVLSNSWRPQELQHARPPCPSPTPGVHPNPCPLSRWCHPQSYLLSSPSPLALNLFQHWGLFKRISSLHQVAKVLEFQLQHQSFHEHPGLISFRMDWLDLLAVQETLKSLLQHHTSKPSILWRSAFFIVQLLYPNLK